MPDQSCDSFLPKLIFAIYLGCKKDHVV